jgi:hypothetical protein
MRGLNVGSKEALERFRLVHVLELGQLMVGSSRPLRAFYEPVPDNFF